MHGHACMGERACARGRAGAQLGDGLIQRVSMHLRVPRQPLSGEDEADERLRVCSVHSCKELALRVQQADQGPRILLLAGLRAALGAALTLHGARVH